ncbi:hypothetical protein [Nitrosomonas sp.]|uniref:hypothetical protein n=1 Tax=Nitrosomonas sp. TaxID=42353 RepID=UPI0025CF11ED|nr:hypothetical protein [Nitrosomonas sp.]
MLIYEMINGEYSNGAFACVFFDNSGFATKIFFKKKDISREDIEKVFQYEVDAHEIAAKNENIKKYVPEFFGTIQCNQKKIIDSCNKDISDRFHLDLAYKMKKIDAVSEEKGLNDKRLIELFTQAGIEYVKDCSVLIDKDTNTFVIDFATKEHEIIHKDLWADSHSR